MPWLFLFGIIYALPYLIPAFYEFLTKNNHSLLDEYYRVLKFVDTYVSSLLTSTMILACRNWHTKSKVFWSNAFLETGQQLHRIIGTHILFMLVVAAGILCLVIPGIIMALNWDHRGEFWLRIPDHW